MGRLRQLLATADMLIENFRPGSLAKLSLTDQELLSLNPRLWSCRSADLDTMGPNAGAGYDQIAQGEPD
jgi:crotonobetainyl-CoA:carnitine CoA-transferase CaiB-like acyl-CoA transferase